MKALNYSKSHLKLYHNYKELFDDNPELNISIETEGVDIQKERMPFGKYRGMMFIDLIEYDKNYFNYIKNAILNEPLSSSLITHSQKIKMLRVMFSVERYFLIERHGKNYGQRKEHPESTFRRSSC